MRGEWLRDFRNFPINITPSLRAFSELRRFTSRADLQSVIGVSPERNWFGFLFDGFAFAAARNAKSFDGEASEPATARNALPSANLFSTLDSSRFLS